MMKVQIDAQSCFANVGLFVVIINQTALIEKASKANKPLQPTQRLSAVSCFGCALWALGG